MTGEDRGIDTTAAPSSRGNVTVLYDADCSFCMASVRWLQRRDREGRLTFLALQDAEASTEPRSPAIAAGHDLRSALHVIDGTGRVTEGGAAMAGVLRLLPHWRVLGRLGALPPARPLVEWAYRLIAGHRLGLGRLVGAEGPACRMPPAGGAATA